MTLREYIEHLKDIENRYGGDLPITSLHDGNTGVLKSSFPIVYRTHEINWSILETKPSSERVVII